jgi:hypothetical protein
MQHTVPSGCRTQQISLTWSVKCHAWPLTLLMAFPTQAAREGILADLLAMRNEVFNDKMQVG